MLACYGFPSAWTGPALPYCGLCLLMSALTCSLLDVSFCAGVRTYQTWQRAFPAGLILGACLPNRYFLESKLFQSILCHLAPRRGLTHFISVAEATSLSLCWTERLTVSCFGPGAAVKRLRHPRTAPAVRIGRAGLHPPPAAAIVP